MHDMVLEFHLTRDTTISSTIWTGNRLSLMNKGNYMVVNPQIYPRYLCTSRVGRPLINGYLTGNNYGAYVKISSSSQTGRRGTTTRMCPHARRMPLDAATTRKYGLTTNN